MKNFVFSEISSLEAKINQINLLMNQVGVMNFFFFFLNYVVGGLCHEKANLLCWNSFYMYSFCNLSFLFCFIILFVNLELSRI